MSTDQLGLVAERPSPLAQPTPASEAAPDALETPATFDQLGLTPELLRAVAAQGYTVPTPVQAQSIPIVLAGRDLLAGAQTGTGKTAAFVLPILQLLNASRPAPRQLGYGERRPRGATGLPIRCLVLTPTRELALQIEESVRTYGAERPIRSTTIYGGVGFDPQVRALRTGPEIVVATPGPAARPCRAGHDRPQFGRDPRPRRGRPDARHGLHPRHPPDPRPAAGAPPEPALLGHVLGRDPRAGGTLLNDPAYVQIARRNAPIELVRQVVYPVDRERKRELLSHLDPQRPDRPGARLHPHQARRQPPRRAARRWTASPPPRSTATRARASGSAPSTTSRPVGSPSWSRRRSRHAASTSTACRTSSTSSCRWWPRTTSTGSAGRAAPAWRATRCRSSASTRTRSWLTSKRCSASASPARSSRASRWTARFRESRSASAVWAADDKIRQATPALVGPGCEVSNRVPRRLGPVRSRRVGSARPHRVGRARPRRWSSAGRYRVISVQSRRGLLARLHPARSAGRSRVISARSRRVDPISTHGAGSARRRRTGSPRLADRSLATTPSPATTLRPGRRKDRQVDTAAGRRKDRQVGPTIGLESPPAGQFPQAAGRLAVVTAHPIAAHLRLDAGRAHRSTRRPTRLTPSGFPRDPAALLFLPRTRSARSGPPSRVVRL